MAITKIKPIKNTLKKAINYISNPDKTDSGLLVSTFGCSLETADLEFEFTENKGRKSKRIAYHMLQSFSPEDDITPEKAHELGMEFAKEMTKGQYEFVLATHIDKGHIHNHIIFNATNFVTYGKYHNSVSEKYRMRRVNDKICRENNLSVIENPSMKREKTKYEYEQIRAGKSWKDKLRTTIDELILKANSYEEFIEMLELEGVEIKGAEIKEDAPKYISYKPLEADKFVRGSERGLGIEYSKERIRERILNKEFEIANKSIVANDEKIKKEKNEQKEGIKINRPDSKKINLLIDVTKNIKAQQSKGYENALLRSNINNLVKSMNYLIRHNITTTEDFKTYSSGLKAEYDLTRKSIKRLDNEMIDLSEKIKFLKDYQNHKNIYQKYTHAGNKGEFYSANQEAILKFQTAMVFFERNNFDPKAVNLTGLFTEYKSKKQERSELYSAYTGLKKDVKEMGIVEHNLEESLNIDLSNNGSIDNVKKTDDIER